MGNQHVTPTNKMEGDRQPSTSTSQQLETPFAKLQASLGNRVGRDRFKADLDHYQQTGGEDNSHPIDVLLARMGSSRPRQNRDFRGLSHELQSEALPSSQSATPHPNQTGLPDSLKTGIETLSGYSLDDVRVHYDSDKPKQLHAHAYTQGKDIYVASGQEQHLPHEGWHVVQQKQGRVKPTTQTEGVAINESGSLEHEADVMGAKALQTCGSGAFAYPVSTSNLLTAQPDGTIQRVRLTGKTGGVQYDPKKLTELKGEEMKKWKGLPGFESSEDFTWHHVAPQSRIERRSLASNPLLVRLGPSASARIGDPGNDFTDPNTDPTGTLTPYSEKVETSLGETPGIDPVALTLKLQVLADEQKEDVGKSLSNPHLWHIPKKVLLDHIDKYPTDAEVTAAQKEKMREIVNKKAVLISYKNYKDTESPDRKEHAVPITALHESEESGIGKEMKNLFHKVIYKRPSFVRGHVLDPFSSKKFGVKSNLVDKTVNKFIDQVSKDAELKKIIKETGTELLQKKGILAGFNELSKALQALVVAPSGSGRSFMGVEHTYFTGKNVTLNEDAFRKACKNVETFRKDWPNDHKIKNLPIHRLKPEPKKDDLLELLKVPKQTLAEEERATIDQETKIDHSLVEEMSGEIEASPVLPTSKTGWKNIEKKQKPSKGNKRQDKYLITTAEKSLWKELVYEENKDELANLKNKVKARGKITDLETNKKTLIEQLLEEKRIKRVEAMVQSKEQELQDAADISHLEQFRLDQDERLSKLNVVIEKFNGLYSGEAKKIDVNSFSFLMHHWPDMETTIAELTYRLTYNIAADKEPTSESDFDSYSKNLSEKYDQALKDVLSMIRKEFVSYVKAE